jgi:hypothetical protein
LTGSRGTTAALPKDAAGQIEFMIEQAKGYRLNVEDFKSRYGL